MEFSNTTTKNGLIQLLEDLTATQSATSNTYSLAKKTRDINNALGNFFIIGNQASGRWQLDDTNQLDYPTIFADIISGRQDYGFLTDQQGNQILDIYKVRAKDANGNWLTLKQRDLNAEDGDDSWLNSGSEGSPTEYDLTANGIILNVTPNYNSTLGLEVYVARTPSYFLTTDTGKNPGIPNVFHEYLALRPAYFYCLQRGMKQSKDYKVQLYGADGKSGIEGAIRSYYSNRNRDERIVLQPPITNDHI